MKLRNKKTGEIKEWDFGNWYQSILNPNGKSEYECSLNEFIDRTVKFREEWEDAPEEPWSTSFYTIVDGKIKHCIFYRERITGCPSNTWAYLKDDGKERIKQLKEVGLYFETEKEARKAAERLRAWTRLKGKGFRFNGWRTWEDMTGLACFDKGVAHSYYAGFTFRSEDRLEKDKQTRDDLDLLFSQEEE